MQAIPYIIVFLAGGLLGYWVRKYRIKKTVKNKMEDVIEEVKKDTKNAAWKFEDLVYRIRNEMRDL